MFFQNAPSFSGLAAGQRATLQVPAWNVSLGKALLKLGGGLTKANISEIVLKHGSRVIFGPVSGAQVDQVMKYRGQTDHASFINLDLTEREGMNAFAKEVGAIDLQSTKTNGLFLEVVNTLASGTPTLTATMGLTARQWLPGNKKADGGAPSEAWEIKIHKLLRYVIPNNGGTQQVWQPNFRGAEIKRIHFIYTGTDWTSTTNGNLYSVEVKKNGVSLHDRAIDCLTNRFVQTDQGRVPQSRTFTVDFLHDNMTSGMLSTANATSLEFILNLTAGDTVTALVECYDNPDNL